MKVEKGSRPWARLGMPVSSNFNFRVVFCLMAIQYAAADHADAI